MATEPEEEREEVLGNGDTLPERLEVVDLEGQETCSTDEMRERLGL